MSKRPLGFQLAYQTITCPGCSSNRVRGVRCPDCGKQPEKWEVNAFVLHRRQLVTGLQAALDAEPAAADAAPWSLVESNVFGEFLDLLPRLFAALQQAAKEDGYGGALRVVVEDFVDLRGRIRRSQHKRPFVGLTRAAESAAFHIEQVIRHYLSALAAATPVEGQHHATEAQTHLDQAGTATAELSKRSADFDRLDTTSSSAAARSLISARLDRTGETLQELFAGAEARVADLLQIEPSADGSQLQYLISEDLAASELDLERFTKTFTDAYTLISQHQAKLVELVGTTPELITDYIDSQVTVFNSCWNLSHLVQHAQTPRQAAEGVLDLQGTLVEGPGALIVRLLLLVTGLKQKPYKALKDGNATDDLRAARRDPRLDPLLAGLNDHLRIAKSHHTVTYTDHSIIATTKSQGNVEVEHDDLVDLVFEGLESVLACLLALRQALGQANIEVADEEIGEQIGIPLLDIAEMAIGFETGCDTQVYLDDDEIVVEIDGSIQTPLLNLAAFVSPALKQADRLRIIHTDGLTSRQLTGPTTQLREPSPEQEFDNELRVIRICLSMRIDDDPLISVEHVRQWCTAKAGAALIRNDLDSMREMRTMITLAKETHDADLEALMRRSMKWLRTGQPDQEVVELLGAWARRNLDWEMP